MRREEERKITNENEENIFRDSKRTKLFRNVYKYVVTVEKIT